MVLTEDVGRMRRKAEVRIIEQKGNVDPVKRSSYPAPPASDSGKGLPEGRHQ